MESGSSGRGGTTERWNQLYGALSAVPRRRIIHALMSEPEERRLPLPDAAAPADSSVDGERFLIELRHHHLPMLADAGYVRWEEDPFCVQRGPEFEEAEIVLRRVMEPVDGLPEQLIEDCPILQELHHGH